VERWLIAGSSDAGDAFPEGLAQTGEMIAAQVITTRIEKLTCSLRRQRGAFMAGTL